MIEYFLFLIMFETNILLRFVSMRSIIFSIGMLFFIEGHSQVLLSQKEFEIENGIKITEGSSKDSNLLDVTNYISDWKEYKGQVKDLDLGLFYETYSPGTIYQHYSFGNGQYILTVLPKNQLEIMYNRYLKSFKRDEKEIKK